MKAGGVEENGPDENIFEGVLAVRMDLENMIFGGFFLAVRMDLTKKN